MQLQPVETRAISVWRWEAIFAAFIILVSASVPLFASRLPASIALVIIATTFALLLGWTLWYPRARFRHMGWCLDDNGLTIQSGVFWRSQSTVARIRIQHTDVSQGPLQRHYGIATLKLYTAGSHFSRIELPGLSYSSAVRLRDELQSVEQSAGNEDAV